MKHQKDCNGYMLWSKALATSLTENTPLDDELDCVGLAPMYPNLPTGTPY
jgi:hypothetical protein